ncbi:MAG: hypothetical protein Mars2KO_16490 [Maribacter sp.]
MKFTSAYLKTLLIALFFLGMSSKTWAQDTLSTSDWQVDLRFLQKTVHTSYPFLFKKVTAKKFDAEVEKFYEEIPDLEAHEIKVGMARMVSLFAYGHTQIPFSTIAKEAVLPVNLYHFKEGVFVEGVRKGDEKALGAKVLQVAGTAVTEALKAVRPVVPVENDQYFKAYGLRFLTVPSVLHAQGVIADISDSITLTLEKEGVVFDHTFTAVPLSELSRDYCLTIPNETWISVRPQDETPLYLKQLNEKFYFFEFLPESKTLYVRQSSVFNDDKESLQDFYTRLFEFIDTNAVEKLVYDVRLNGGGNNFNNKPFIKGIMARPKINTRGKFFYIIGRNTFSACQNLTNEIENYTEAIIVGEPTSENKNFYGDARRVRLPNSGINAYLSHAWWQDFAPWDTSDWTLPHIAVEMGFADYIANEDPVLEAAMNYTETGFILDPLDHLTQLFVAGKFEQLRSDGKRIAQDPAYKYYDFKEEFSTAGYRLLQGGNVEGGLFVLELITEYYPDSVGSLFNLATAQEQAKQVDKAKESYKKLLALDSNSPMVQAARNNLENLEKQ